MIMANIAPSVNASITAGSDREGFVNMDNLNRWYTHVCGRNQDKLEAPGNRIESKYVTGNAIPANKLASTVSTHVTGSIDFVIMRSPVEIIASPIIMAAEMMNARIIAKILAFIEAWK